jgi:hypothetical protein
LFVCLFFWGLCIMLYLCLPCRSLMFSTYPCAIGRLCLILYFSDHGSVATVKTKTHVPHSPASLPSISPGGLPLLLSAHHTHTLTLDPLLGFTDTRYLDRTATDRHTTLGGQHHSEWSFLSLPNFGQRQIKIVDVYFLSLPRLKIRTST